FRQFTFFDVVPVKDIHDLDSPPDIFKAPLELSTVASSSVGVIVADIHGSVHILDSNFEPVQSWVAHVRGRVTHAVESRGMLLTMGEEDAVKNPILKIWDLSNRDKKTGAPVVLRSTEVKLSNRPHPVTAVALSSNFSHLAIGLGDGTVVLYRHLDQSLASSNSLISLPKLRTVHESPNEPITGLGFREPSPEDYTNGHTNGDNSITNPSAAPGLAANTSLFVVTTNRVLSYQISGKGSGGPAIVVDEIGAALGCSTMDWKGRDIVIARSEAIYMCGTEGRGTCYAYEGSKSSIHTHLNYLIIVSPPIVPTVTAASATIRNFAARNANGPETDVTKVTVFDPENKLVVYSGPFTQGVRQVVSQWGNVYILTNDGHLLCLQEKPTSAKLDMLYRKALYPLALSVARTQSLEEESVAEIHQYYGDHLYAKGDFDGAMTQYIQTIGHLQPSYVIRKYLDAQRINSLVNYLQELHNLGLANADHTTLLLNTYTKLKDVSRLDTFIKTESRRAKDGEDKDELPFDLDTAIRVCRQAGYYDHASYLAKKYERHEDFLRIQIEDAGNYGEALKYLRKLGVDAAESNLARYGRAMLEQLPEETTQLLIDLCTGLEPGQPAVVGPQPTRQSTMLTTSSGPSYLSYLALNRAPAVLPTVSSPDPNTITSTSTVNTPTPPSPSIKTVKPDTASRRADSVYEAPRAPTPSAPTSSRLGAAAAGNQHERQQSTATTGAVTTAVIAPPPPPPKRLSPRIYFAHFVDHMEQFLKFLEIVAARRWKQSVGAGGTMEPGQGHGQRHGKDRVTVSPYSQDSNSSSDFDGNAEDEENERSDQVAVWNTLLELYLTLKKEDKKEEEELREKALKVLKSDVLPFDVTHALILCSTRGFTKGLVLLWEKMGMYEEVVRHWIDRHKEWESGQSSNNTDASSNVQGERASDKVVKCLDEYGETNRHLYPLVLRFLTSTSELLRRHEGDVKRILEVVDREGIIPPVGVVQVLSRNGVASVGLIKEWLMKRIKSAREEIKSDLELTKSYRAETAAKLQQVATLSDPEHARVLHVTRCSACGGQIDLPVVHFMCDHSYHQRCLVDQEYECPNCVREHGFIKEIRRNNERLADQHDVFKQEVQEAGFEAVATAFSRGFLNMRALEGAGIGNGGIGAGAAFS
ncbi:hypothetical protein AX16_002806, partial [Volvariella volvacea WC 439]